VDCSFDPVASVLDSWHGDAEDDRQCIWNVDKSGDTFTFQIQSDLNDPVERVKLPVLVVNDDRPRRSAIDRSDSPTAIPGEISSRSSSDSRNKHHSATGTGRRQPEDNNRVLIVAGARSNTLAIDR
jgi:hypothetical protein